MQAIQSSIINLVQKHSTEQKQCNDQKMANDNDQTNGSNTSGNRDVSTNEDCSYEDPQVANNNQAILKKSAFASAYVEPIEEEKKVEVQEANSAAMPLQIQFRPSSSTDDYRSNVGHSDGGFALTDKQVVSKYRSAFKTLVGQIGSQIMKGDFNLTTVSLPIKAMDYNSILQTVTTMATISSHFYTLAALSSDPFERMKLVITASIAYLEPTHHWNKPLNPILGETYQAQSPDGSMYYLEQVSHRPPISYFVHYGPSDIFRLSSYTQFDVHAHLNSIDCNVSGRKKIEFLRDGTDIVFNQHSDSFKNTIFGTLSHQIRGALTYTDEANGIQAELKFGNVKKKAKDYFSGVIRQRAANDPTKWLDVTQIRGTYLGYIEFDGIRYWDLRETEVQSVDGVPFEQEEIFIMPSDCRLRMDSIELRNERVEEAQANKNALENRQREDTKLRQAAEQRRAKKGPKIVYSYRTPSQQHKPSNNSGSQQ